LPLSLVFRRSIVRQLELFSRFVKIVWDHVSFGIPEKEGGRSIRQKLFSFGRQYGSVLLKT
jgi:hypothetical protein